MCFCARTSAPVKMPWYRSCAAKGEISARATERVARRKRGARGDDISVIARPRTLVRTEETYRMKFSCNRVLVWWPDNRTPVARIWFFLFLFYVHELCTISTTSFLSIFPYLHSLVFIFTSVCIYFHPISVYSYIYIFSHFYVFICMYID